MRKWKALKRGKQLSVKVEVHKSFRQAVLLLGHEDYLGGQLGIRKSRNRMLNHFLRPNIFKDIVEVPMLLKKRTVVLEIIAEQSIKLLVFLLE